MENEENYCKQKKKEAFRSPAAQKGIRWEALTFPLPLCWGAPAAMSITLGEEKCPAVTA